MTDRRNRKQKQTPPPPLRQQFARKRVTGRTGKKEKEKKTEALTAVLRPKFQSGELFVQEAL